MNQSQPIPSGSVRECVRNLNLRVQVHTRELLVSKQRVHIVLEASNSAGAKGDVPKICGFVHPMHPCQRIPCIFLTLLCEKMD